MTPVSFVHGSIYAAKSMDGRERRLYLGEADKDEVPVDICPAQRVVMDGYPELLHEARWRSEKVFMP